MSEACLLNNTPKTQPSPQSGDTNLKYKIYLFDLDIKHKIEKLNRKKKFKYVLPI